MINIMKTSLTLFFIFWTVLGQAQDEKGFEENSTEFSILKPSPEAVVKEHKINLKLTLIIDSIILYNKKVIPFFRTTIPISFESDYIRVNDSLYLKIFIARNQEYGSKFYSWKWDFLKKKSSQYYSQGISSYEMMDFNGSLNSQNGSIGHGVGTEGTPTYVMYYYRYKLE